MGFKQILRKTSLSTMKFPLHPNQCVVFCQNQVSFYHKVVHTTTFNKHPFLNLDDAIRSKLRLHTTACPLGQNVWLHNNQDAYYLACPCFILWVGKLVYAKRITLFCHSCEMENMNIINMMRTMKVTMSLDLEDYHHKFGGKLHRGRSEMLLLRMRNERNVQLFRRGTIKILGHLFPKRSWQHVQRTSTPLDHSNETVSDLEHGGQCRTKDKTMSEEDCVEWR